MSLSKFFIEEKDLALKKEKLLGTEGTLRVLSVDPGRTATGWAVSDFDFKSENFKVINFNCIKFSSELNKIKRKFPEESKFYSNPQCYHYLMRKSFDKIIKTYKPDIVTCEDTFANPKFIAAFKSLTQCILSLGSSAMNSHIHFYLIPPTKIKQGITGYGFSGKEDIIEKVKHHPKISFAKKTKNINKIVEHEADAISCGFLFVSKIL